MFALWISLVCQAYWLSCQTPEWVVLRDGQRLPALDYRMDPKGITLKDRHHNLLLIRFYHVDFRATFLPQPVEPLPINRTVNRRWIPWQHPAFRNKREGFRSIEISNKDLLRFSRSKPRVSDSGPISGQMPSQPPPDEEGARAGKTDNPEQE